MNDLAGARRWLARIPRAIRLLVLSPVQIVVGVLAVVLTALVAAGCLAHLVAPVVAWRYARRLDAACPAGAPSLEELWRQTARLKASRSALQFEALSIAAGIDVTPPGLDSRPHLAERRKAEAQAERDLLRKYWDERRLRADDEWMECPPPVRAHIEAPAFEAGRDFLLRGEPLAWEFDRELGESGPQMNLLGLLSWARLLGVDALESAREGDPSRAAASLEAAWKVRETMARRPQLLAGLLALAVEQDVESVLRLLDAPPAIWTDRLRRCDHEALLARDLRNEVLLWVGVSRHGWRYIEKDAPFRMILLADPMMRAGSPRLAADLERAVAASAALTLPEATPERLAAIWNRQFPFLDVLGRSGWPDLSDAVYRRLRVSLQHELTTLVIRVRAGEAVGERVPSLVHPGEAWLVTPTEVRFSRRLREPDTSLFRPPLRFVLRRTRA